MIFIKTKLRITCLFLFIQLAALLLCKGYQKKVTYIFQIFCEPDATSSSGLNHTASDSNGTYCPGTSILTGGPLVVNFPSGLILADVEKKNPLVTPGGCYSPPDCEARHRTAIIIPYRHRENHLKYLLYHLHPFLQRQQLSYQIYIINQAGNHTFNRAKLMNVGFREAMKKEDWDCLIFHDVDLIPEDDRNSYTCDSNPKHAAIAMDKFGYGLPYSMYFGGVIALTPLHYLKMNGFPNNYWGWGGEDDDIAFRVLLTGMKVVRPKLQVGRYKMIRHTLDQGNAINQNRFEMLSKARQTWRLDGMNTVEYELITQQYMPLYTNITVNIGTQDGLHSHLSAVKK
ncbi:beta-1,4-galactosyltransferase 3 [Cynoglossus semilaevis]|uniref:Beta-1,4-galactosyltransferase n=1 Tax=Cynoglossus semilaevis TaxID=244447 RepID=A0A3P8VY71_CYNSE|nr:beta-1,4-galactosyltransferase 3-like [Cynoglossus semilaevis]